MPRSPYALVATCSKGTEGVLRSELLELGAVDPSEGYGAVTFHGDLETAYRACLWSRVASRVLLPLATFPIPDAGALYEGVYSVDWTAHLDPDRTFAVSFAGRADAIDHTGFAALKAKDAVVDRLRRAHGRRPDVDPDAPDTRLHLHLAGSEATISLDLSGEPLHRRGYRPRNAPAPLKENLAAAILRLMDWPALASEGAPFVDLMCGSGTLVVEAAQMAADIAPGLHRPVPFGFERWLGHDRTLYRQLREEAETKAHSRQAERGPMIGFDASPDALDLAAMSARQAGVDRLARFEQRSLENAAAPERPSPAPSSQSAGLVLVNPPYGHRLGGAGKRDTEDVGELLPLYQRLGDVLRHRFVGYLAGVLSANRRLEKRIGLRPRARHTLYNGPLECRLLEFPISATPAKKAGPSWRAESEEAAMFRNRLRKNERKLAAWAQRNDVECYRVYDADIPEYNVAVDRYADEVLVQEYERPKKIDAALAERRLQDVLLVVQDVLGVDETRFHLRIRRRHRGGGQYERMGDRGATRIVRERGLRFEVNLTDYLDTGLFLDQRRLRAELAEEASGARFLNLFCYTATATVHAAAGGARSSTSVDLSNTYLDWARRNFELNDVDLARHRLVRADCLRFLEEHRQRYDLIHLAPPSFSRSKAMQQELDLKRDQGELVAKAARMLAPGGRLYFVAHAAGLRPESWPLSGCDVEEISKRTVPPDFARRPHRAFRIHRRS